MKVYLSSTLIDLLPERQAVKDVLSGECAVKESYHADERDLRDSCEADVADCDLYIGIFGLRYGSIAPGQQQSITQLEYAQALKTGKPTLLFVKDKGSILAEFHDAVTGENPRELIESFRATITTGAKGTARANLFKTADDLKLHVLKAVADWRQRHGQPQRPPIQGPPYPGLRAFRPSEADRFFGRDDEVQALLDRLLKRGDRFIALIGASGSGKSSMVYAGLIPKLAARADGTRWVTVPVIPGKQGEPFLSLATALDQQFPDVAWPVADLAQRLRDDPAQIAAVAEEAIGGPDAAASSQLLLFVDQLEEVFASKVDAGTRAAFFSLLAAAVACPLLRVVISMRADFYAQWPQDEAATRLLRDGHFPVAVPGLAALARMIEGPAEAAHLAFQPPQLVQRILDDTGTQPGALALAEYALAKLYDEAKGGPLTEAAYLKIGRVFGAIDGHAGRAVTKAQQALAKTGQVLDDQAWSLLFTALASVDDQGQDLAVVRRRATATELPGPVLTLVQHLVTERLLVASAGTDDQPAVYEVAHEAVFRHWQRFKSWYALYADDLALRRQVERAANEWDKAGRPDYLRWGWERQKPALLALHKLGQLPMPALDPDFTDVGIALWRALVPSLHDTPLKAFLHPEPLALIDELSLPETRHQRREEIGLRLNQMPDPRQGVGLNAQGLPDIAWIDLPAGEVTIELDAEADPDRQSSRGRWQQPAPPSRFAVRAFQMARYPVTWSQYGAFRDAPDGYANPAWWEGRPRATAHGDPIWSFNNYPVVNVSWFDAMAYCRWLSAKLGVDIRLPTECQWQWAAVADTGREYPWPGVWDPARANSYQGGIGRTAAVGLYPGGRSPFGVDDLSGNVWEWCINAGSQPDTVSADMAAPRVRRGGGWYFAANLRALYRNVSPADGRNHDIGFRVCRVLH